MPSKAKLLKEIIQEEIKSDWRGILKFGGGCLIFMGLGLIIAFFIVLLEIKSKLPILMIIGVPILFIGFFIWGKAKRIFLASREESTQDLSIGGSEERPALKKAAFHTVICTKCGKELHKMKGGLFQDHPGLEQWFGNVCLECHSIFCSECIQVGEPTPCPNCGTPTKPAQRLFLQEIGFSEE